MLYNFIKVFVRNFTMFTTLLMMDIFKVIIDCIDGFIFTFDYFIFFVNITSMMKFSGKFKYCFCQ